MSLAQCPSPKHEPATAEAMSYVDKWLFYHKEVSRKEAGASLLDFLENMDGEGGFFYAGLAKRGFPTLAQLPFDEAKNLIRYWVEIRAH